ncbi:TPA: ead/Ea22-like family protein [Klebsiella pneumoniae]
MTDITELAQRARINAECGEHLSPAETLELVEALESEKRICATWRKTAKSTGEKLEKAQTINAAAEKLVRCKGRYHSEQNYRALAALFGVKPPDLPPLEHENVHYADAAEMEIAALRQRIAELEPFHTAYIEWSDKTAWVQTDKRFDVLKPWGKHRADVLKEYIQHLESRTVTMKQGEVLVTVAGFTGCGKSAIAGEIEIAMKAIGVPVTWANGDSEKRMTGADWLTAIEMYKPTVRIVEENIPRAADILAIEGDAS